MAIIAENQTAGDILITDLGVIVPASGSVDLTSSLGQSEVLDSTDLNTEIVAGNILLNDGTQTLTQANSEALSNSASNIEQYAFEDATIQTTTSTTFQSAISISQQLIGGDYEITVTYGWNHNAANTDFEGRFDIDSVQAGELHKQEPKDAAGTDPTGTTQRYYMTRKYYQNLTAGSHDFELFYRTDDGADASSVYEIVITIKKISQ